MTLQGWLQILLFMGLIGLLTRPTGAWLHALYEGRPTPLHRVLGPLEQGFYRLAGVNPDSDQRWSQYALAMLLFSGCGIGLLYALQRFQDVLPLNPQGFGAVAPDLAMNTAISFVTNTNWQAYGGETTMSHLTQMMGLTVQNFLSAATGIALAFAFIRGFARKNATGLGNFWADVTRITLYLLLPLCLLLALGFIALGVPQTLLASVTATTLEGGQQTLALGPVASQLAIKMLGTNGGGFFNANSAHPFENPTALSNFLQLLCIFVLGAGLTHLFGRALGDRRQGWALLAAMGVLFLMGTAVIYAAESQGNPLLIAQGLDATGGNMEGKEVRFGLAASSLFAATTTAASCGAVNAMHSSFTPLGGLVTLLNIQLGEIIIGGVGSGLYGMLLFAILAVFIAGLMVGRTPDYVGKKIESREIKLAVLAITILPLTILGFTALAALSPAGLAGIANKGPHGFSEILYAFTSAAGNNGSAFAGLSANTPFYNATLAIAMFLGRFFVIIPMLAIAGSLAAKTPVPTSSGAFPTTSALWVGLLVGVILILGGLTFLPALALGPIAEQAALVAGHTY